MIAGRVIHQPHEHPARPGHFRWLMSESGAVYWLQRHADGWEIFTEVGTTVIRGLDSLRAVQDWIDDGELPADPEPEGDR